MPIFEYKCIYCGKKIEKLQSKPLVPMCCGHQMNRQYSLNFRLRGECWEKDGYMHENLEACKRTIGPSPLIYNNKYFRGGLSK